MNLFHNNVCSHTAVFTQAIPMGFLFDHPLYSLALHKVMFICSQRWKCSWGNNSSKLIRSWWVGRSWLNSQVGTVCDRSIQNLSGYCKLFKLSLFLSQNGIMRQTSVLFVLHKIFFFVYTFKRHYIFHY